MKKFTSTRLFAIVCMIVLGIVQTWAQTMNKPTITPGTKDSNGNYSCDFDGSIKATITADKGCTIIYKWGSSATTSEKLQASTSATHVDNNVATTTKHYTNSRVLSAIAAKTENGTTTYSEATIATFNYVADAKKTLTLTAEDFKVDINKTQQITVTAKDGDTEVSGLKFTYESDKPNIATVNDNGVVTGVGAGNCYITISFAGNDTYKDASTSINVGVNSNATSYATGTVFTNIADVRAAGQLIPKGDKTTYTWIINFTENNPATVVGVLKVDDSKLGEGKGSVFIVDNTGRGLWIPSNDKNTEHIKDLEVGDKITGTLVGVYKERKSVIPEFTTLSNTYNSEKTDFKIDKTGETENDGKPLYPVNEITDVNTITNTNDSEGNIVTSSYGIYLNTIVSVPGTIRLGADETYYLMQDESTNPNENYDKRLAINTEQIGVNIADYVNTTGTFEGVLLKNGKQYAKLVVLKDDFFQINKIYLDENDDEKRIDDLVNAGAFDDEVDVYVHRTKLVNTNDTWGTLCFPFDLTKDEFKNAFGCELTDLAAPKVTSEGNDANGRLTKNGEVSGNDLVFEKVSDLEITEGMPYLMKATGTQTACANTKINYKKEDGTIKTPQELMEEDKNYYAEIGQKTITVVPPHQIKANSSNEIVGGDFYFRGLYGSKQYTENEDGTLTKTYISDNGSQKYQFISNAPGNYLKYLKSGANTKFPGYRAYFYFPNWDSAKNNAAQTNPDNTNNAKVHFAFEGGSTTGISDIATDDNNNDGRIYNLAGQVVDKSYKGIVIKNGRKYLAK